jgi:hypothetical protein
VWEGIGDKGGDKEKTKEQKLICSNDVFEFKFEHANLQVQAETRIDPQLDRQRIDQNSTEQSNHKLIQNKT